MRHKCVDRVACYLSVLGTLLLLRSLHVALHQRQPIPASLKLFVPASRPVAVYEWGRRHIHFDCLAQLCAGLRHRRRQVADAAHLVGAFKAKDYGAQSAYYSGVFNVAPGSSLDVKARHGRRQVAQCMQRNNLPLQHMATVVITPG